MTKIDIISGFLGAGKTTLIKKLLEESLKGEQVVLIENEYGEVGIDGGFLKDSGIEITEMNSGCICCTLAGDFVESIGEILDRFSPDRIIIEPSGVGKLSDVMAAVIDMEKDRDIKLDSLTTVVNTLKFKKQKLAFGEFFNNQIEHATSVILSRSQDATPAQLESCQKMIREANPKAAIITTPWDDISGDKILAVMEGIDNVEAKAQAMIAHQHDHEAHAHHHHDHDHEHEHHDHDHECCHHHDHEHDHEHHHDHDHECCHHHDHDHEHHHDHDHECCHHHDHDHDHEHHHDHDHEHHHHEHDHGHHHHDHHGHHHADEIFDTWGMETAHLFTQEEVENALKLFASGESCGNILRAKGMVQSQKSTWIYFDFVEGDYELRDGEPDYTGRLVVIGTDLDEAEIKKAFGLE